MGDAVSWVRAKWRATSQHVHLYVHRRFGSSSLAPGIAYLARSHSKPLFCPKPLLPPRRALQVVFMGLELPQNSSFLGQPGAKIADSDYLVIWTALTDTYPGGEQRMSS